MEQAISFDIWNTLLTSNPEFKSQQIKLAKEFGIIDFAAKKETAKKTIDNIVEESGIHPDRIYYYKNLFPQLSYKQVEEFIEYSNHLFLLYPPNLKCSGTKATIKQLKENYRVYISSNTVFIYGDTLGKVIYDYFGIIKSNCNFSDEIGVSKPHGKMFEFKTKPIYHVGDNLITDGAAEKFGIKHYHFNDKQNIITFWKHLTS